MSECVSILKEIIGRLDKVIPPDSMGRSTSMALILILMSLISPVPSYALYLLLISLLLKSLKVLLLIHPLS